MADLDQTRFAAQQAIEEAVEARAQQALSLIADLRQALLTRMSSANAFELARLQELRDAIDAGVDRLKERLGELVQVGQADAITQGAAIVETTLGAVELSVLVPDVTQGLLLALQDTTLSLVNSLGDNLRRDLVREVQLGTLGVKSPQDVIQAIDQLLGAEGATGYANRAETITRTEIGRAQSQATQARLEDATRTLGNRVQKEWRHSGLAQNARSTHQAATGQRRPVREPFSVGGASLMYPRDPAAPASATVNCRCVMVPYVQPLGG